MLLSLKCESTRDVYLDLKRITPVNYSLSFYPSSNLNLSSFTQMQTASALIYLYAFRRLLAQLNNESSLPMSRWSEKIHRDEKCRVDLHFMVDNFFYILCWRRTLVPGE
jgi:hypothetical protein